ncbi:MAG: prepilin-type N-terminal cleavage/methylation domain-containing protein [Desulfobacterales bacterium]|nr:prepilin-type N-terminal cleavage/methylation domain-containing protein [Desulfobacterales bacterium]
MNNNKNKRGFTLLEVMISIALLAIVLVSVFRLNAQSITMNTDSRFNTVAPMLAQMKISEIDSLEDIYINEGDFGENFHGYRWKTEVLDINSETFGNLSQDMKRIDLIISNDVFTYKVRIYRLLHEDQ